MADATSGPASISSNAIAELFSPWAGAASILAAVSGGPDSMALVHMLASWQGRPGRPHIHAATVNHGLRPDALREAELASKFATSLAIPHKTLLWDSINVRTRLQEKARAARYDLLQRHAAAIGADVLMTAHHADDQAETVLFRLIRGSGLRGLAGMAASRKRGPFIHARPLLGIRKCDLVDYCRRHSIAFCSDPSNADARFARVRMRALLPALETEGLGPLEWARFARRNARAEAALASAAGIVCQRLVSGSTEAGLHADFVQLANEPEEIILRLLIACVGRFDPGNPVRLERAEALLAQLMAARNSGKGHAATLGQTQIKLTTDGMLSIEVAPERKRGLTEAAN